MSTPPTSPPPAPGAPGEIGVRTPRRSRALVVAHTRWERASYLPFESSRFHLVRLLDQVLDLLAGDSGYSTFTLDGQTVLLEDYLEIRPERRVDVERLVRARRLLAGPCFVPPDEFLVSGEALIRNLQRGLRSVRALGGQCRDAWMPDACGHPAQLPQILAGLGLRSFFFVRGMTQSLFDRAGLEFTWEAPDGSRVLALYLRGGADNAAALGRPDRSGAFDGRAPDVEAAIARLSEAVKELAPHSRSGVLVLGNGGEHRLPEVELPRLLEEARAALPALELEQASCTAVVDAVLTADVPLEIYRGELLGNAHHPILSSVWSARMELKLANHRVQSLLEKVAEPLVAALGPAAGNGGGREHVARLDEAWRHLLLCHAETSICGTGVDDVHADDRFHFRQAELAAGAVVRDALRALALRSGLRSEPGREVIAIFNPHPEPLVEEIETEVLWRAPLPPEQPLALTLFDPDGRGVRLFADVIEEDATEAGTLDIRRGARLRIAFQARVPSLGLAFYELVNGPDAVEWGDAGIEEPVLENEHLRVEAKRNGTLKITDKKRGRAYEDALLFEDEPDLGDSRSFSPDPEVKPATTRGANHAEIEAWRGPNAAFVRIDLDWAPAWLPRTLRETHAIRLSSIVRLADGADRVECTTSVDTLLTDHRLRVLLPVGLGVEATSAGGTFSIDRRERAQAIDPEDALERWSRYPGELVYTTRFSRDFVHAADESGAVLVSHRGLHEHELVDGPVRKDGARSTMLALTLVRSVGAISVEGGSIRRGHAGPSLATETSLLAPADEAFAYAWQPVPVEAAPAEVAPRALHFAHPAFVDQVWIGAHERPSARPLPLRWSLARVDNPLVSLSAFKLAADGRLVLRLWNRDSRPQKATIALSPELCSGRTPAGAMLCDLDEEPVAPASLVGSIARVELAACRIQTIAFTFGTEP